MMKFLIMTLLFVMNISISWSLMPPKYLSVPAWQSCTKTVTKDTAKFVCLPSQKPTNCPQASWVELTSQQLVQNC